MLLFTHLFIYFITFILSHLFYHIAAGEEKSRRIEVEQLLKALQEDKIFSCDNKERGGGGVRVREGGGERERDEDDSVTLLQQQHKVSLDKVVCDYVCVCVFVCVCVW